MVKSIEITTTGSVRITGTFPADMTQEETLENLDIAKDLKTEVESYDLEFNPFHPDLDPDIKISEPYEGNKEMEELVN